MEFLRKHKITMEGLVEDVHPWSTQFPAAKSPARPSLASMTLVVIRTCVRIFSSWKYRSQFLCLPLAFMCNVILVKIHLHIYCCRSNGIAQQWCQNLFNQGVSIWKLRMKLPWLNVMIFSRVCCGGISITWGKHISMARLMVKFPKSHWCQIYRRGTPCKAPV